MKTSIRAREIAAKLLAAQQLALVGIIAIIAVIMMATSSSFLTANNLSAIALGAAITLVMVVGQTMVIIAGGFDLSIGSTLGLVAITLGELSQHGMSWVPAMIIALAVGVACGAVNGFLVARIGINPLIATLGTLFIFQGVALVVTQSATVFIGQVALVGKIGQGKLAGVGVPVWIALLIALIGWVILRWARYGRELFHVGGNAEAARLVGIGVGRVRFSSYVVMGFLAGIAGVLSIAQIGDANATTGANSELDVIAAVVLGGASLAGGEGSVVGAVLAVALIGLLEDAVVLLGISIYWQQLIVGVVLILAVSTNVLRISLRDQIAVHEALTRVAGAKRTGRRGSPSEQASARE